MSDRDEKLYNLVLEACSILGWNIRHFDDHVEISTPQGSFKVSKEDPSLHIGHPLVNQIFESLLQEGLILVLREKPERDAVEVSSPDYEFLNVVLLSKKKEIRYEPFFRFTFLVEFISQERKSRLYEVFVDSSGEELPENVVEFLKKLKPGKFTKDDAKKFAITYEVTPGPVPSSLKFAYSESKSLLKKMILGDLPQLEEESRQSLLKELERISSYYTRRLREATYPEEIEKIEEEFNLKVEELKQTHRIVVRIRLVGVLVFLSYTVRWSYQIEGDVPDFKVSWNPWLGWSFPVCDVCQKPMDFNRSRKLLFCETGRHFVHGECGEICSVCGRGECYLHGMDKCSVCGASVCSSCQNRCSVCGKPLCPEHTLRCAECGRPLCPEHARECRSCHKIFCPEHIETCPFCEENICKKCGIPCAGCGRYSCPEHSPECIYCGRTLCVEHSNPVFSLDGSFLGHACADHSLRCDVCGRYYPPSSIVRCEAGKEPHMVCKNCYVPEKKSCTDHLLKCPVCGEEFLEKEGIVSDSGYLVCKNCAIRDFYGELKAPDDVFKCRVCGRVLTKNKMSSQENICKSCASAQPGKVSHVEARMLGIPPVRCFRAIDGDHVILILESIGKVIIYERRTFKKL